MRLSRNPYRELEAKLGYKFRDRKLLEMALTHRSFRFEQPDLAFDNQRLEFLGDAVLDLALAEHLYRQFPGMDEGFLTAARSRMASGRALAQYAEKVGLGAHLRIGRGEEASGGRTRPSNVADAFEAVIAAAYLDRGWKAVAKVLKTVFVPDCDALAGATDGLMDNPKGRLQELAQREWREGPRYQVVDTSGPPHARVFTVSAELPNGARASASAASKQEAETRAAARLLAEIGSRKPEPQPAPDASTLPKS